LDAIGSSGHERADSSLVINIGVLRKDGLGFGVGNLGLPGYQIALGFSEGSGNAAEAREFADRVVKRLEQRWHIDVVPAGQGATPMSDCK
jgi:hypothetical protein